MYLLRFETFLSHNRTRSLTLIQYSYLMYIQSQNSSIIPIMSFIGLFLCLNQKPRVFPGSPMVKIPCFQCRGHGFKEPRSHVPHRTANCFFFFLNNCTKSKWGSCVAFSCCLTTAFFNIECFSTYYIVCVTMQWQFEVPKPDVLQNIPQNLYFCFLLYDYIQDEHSLHKY